MTVLLATVMTSTRNRRSLFAPLLLGLTACWFSMCDVSAHAAYESSSPAFAEVLVESPAEISIRFTQELFRRAGANAISVQHIDSESDVATGAPIIDNQNRRVMTAVLEQQLAPGRYLVSWINLSAEDGDEDSGAYPFYIERAASADEIADDRQLATDLLITYPKDESGESGDDFDSDSDGVAVATRPTVPAVVRSATSTDVALGAGPIVFLGVGLVAALVLIGVLGYRLGSRP